MAKRDYYKTLGVSRDATTAEIKRAFRDLARKHHPDVSGVPNAATAFREISEAYAVLSDSKRRAQYDRFGQLADAVPMGFGAVAKAVEEALGDVLGRRRERSHGRDYRYTVEISLGEAARGVRKEIQFVPPGEGRARAYVVTVPAGVSDGASLRVAAEGGKGLRGGVDGDLHVMVRVLEHATLRRVEHDIYSDLAISFADAALGAVVDVETIDGRVKVRIPEGSRAGKTLRLRGKGMPHGSAKGALRGDHLLRLDIDVPSALTEQQRQLLLAFAESLRHTPRVRASKKGLLRKVRSILS